MPPADAGLPPTNKGKRKIDELARAIEKSKRKLKGTEVRGGEEAGGRGRADALVFDDDDERTHIPHLAPTHTFTHAGNPAPRAGAGAQSEGGAPGGQVRTGETETGALSHRFFLRMRSLRVPSSHTLTISYPPPHSPHRTLADMNLPESCREVRQREKKRERKREACNASSSSPFFSNPDLPPPLSPRLPSSPTLYTTHKVN